MASVTVEIETRDRLAFIAYRIVCALRHVIGTARAQRWATAAFVRLVRYRVLGGKWERIKER